MGKIGSYREWHKIIKDTRSEAEEYVEILAVGDDAAINGLLGSLGPGASAIVRRFSVDVDDDAIEKADLLVVCLSASAPIDQSWRSLAGRARRFGLDTLAFLDASGLNEAAVNGKVVEAEIALGLSASMVLCRAPDVQGDCADEKVLSAIYSRMEEKKVALAAAAPFFRPLVVKRIIDEVAGENGVIGAVSWLPGADLPVLTANQIRMVLKIAAAHGVSLTLKRAKEIMVIVGGGFTLRAIARQLVGLFPVAGWAVKGAVAYTGTRALGLLAFKYFSDLKEKGPV